MVLGAIFVLGPAVDAGLRLRDMRRELSLASASVDRSRAALTPLVRFEAGAWPNRGGYDRLVADLGSAQEHLERARSRMGYLRWVARAVGVIPVVGEQVGAGPDAIDLGASVATHATALLRIGEPLFAGSGGIAARAREVLVARGPELQREIAGLQADGVEAERLRRVRWMGPLQRAQRLVDGLAHDLAEAKTAGAIASAAATGLDPLLGFDQRRTYVVLGQNEQEIRANGGYTGTMGVVVIERGRLVSSEYRSSVEFDPPKLPNRRPPQSLSQSMGAGLWMVRDAAWDPDFPVSAERVLQFLKEDQGIEADGVIAVNTPMIQLLLRATGPVTVEQPGVRCSRCDTRS